jgi:hypothetical protein
VVVFPKSKFAPEGISVSQLLDTLRLFLAYIAFCLYSVFPIIKRVFFACLNRNYIHYKCPDIKRVSVSCGDC